MVLRVVLILSCKHGDRNYHPPDVGRLGRAYHFLTVSGSSREPPEKPFQSGDYSYTLEIVMGLQVTIGQLKEAVETLKAQTKGQGEKLDRISHIIYGATAVVTVL